MQAVSKIILIVFACDNIFMSKNGHQMVGVALAVMSFSWIHAMGYVWLLSIAGAIAAFFGSTAPDWLEISHAERDANGRWQRHSIIPHRTLTHWVPLWIALLLWSARSLLHTHGAPVLTGSAYAALMGFAIGGIGHLLCDIPNPSGVPVFLPVAQGRISLRMWQSGAPIEWLEVLAFLASAVIAVVNL